MFVILIALTIITSAIIFLYPNLVDYPYSYNNLVEKQEQIENKNYDLNQNESILLGKVNEFERLEEEREMVYDEAFNLKRNIREEDFIMDMPAFLISMEQQAKSDKVKLIIDYNSIVTTSGSTTPSIEMSDGQHNSEGHPNDPNNEQEQLESDEQEEDERDNENNNDSEDNGENSNDKDSDSEEENLEADIMEVTSGQVTIEGLDVTTIPIRLEGSYSNIRDYLKYLDRIGMIEPSSINLTSEEKLVKGTVILNVFHGEVVQ